MADNVTLPGTGEIVAADELAGAKVQRVKPHWGADGSGVDAAKTTSAALPVQQVGSSATWTAAANLDIDTGNTSQTLFSSNTDRRGIMVQNLSSGDLWLGLGATAVANAGIRIPPGAIYESPAHGFITGAINIVGATAGQAFSAYEW